MSRPRVFISYNHEDQLLIPSVIHWLKNSEFRSADVDDAAKSVSWGDDVRTVITEKIRQADAVLLLWSDRAARSPWVQYEMGMAEAFEIPVRALQAEDSTSKLPAELARTPIVKLDIPIGESAAGGTLRDPVGEVSVLTALEDVKQQSQRIEQKIKTG